MAILVPTGHTRRLIYCRTSRGSCYAVTLLLVSMVVSLGCKIGQEQWGPFRGQVVDAETGKPIAGAHVFVIWGRDAPSLHIRTDFYDAQETVTDSNGWFEIPRVTRYFSAFVGKPGVGFFAPGYVIHEEQVTPVNGRKYIDQTVTKMRRLKTHGERCLHAPDTSGIPQHKLQRFRDVAHAYRRQIGC